MACKTAGVYMIKNNLNGKVYIGQSRHLEKRWIQHISMYKRYLKGLIHKVHPILWSAFNKYGIENFKFEVVALCPKEYLNKMEVKFIDLFSSFGGGYNANRGGNVGGVPASPIYQFTTEGVFIRKWETYLDIIDHYGDSSKSSVSQVSNCKGNRYSAYNSLWGKSMDISKQLSRYNKGNTNLGVRKRIAQIKDGNTIKIWDSVVEAAKFLKIKNPSSIYRVANGHDRSCRGFKWKYIY